MWVGNVSVPVPCCLQLHHASLRRLGYPHSKDDDGMDAPHTLQKRALGLRCSCPHGKRCETSERTGVGASGTVGTSECSSAPVGSTDVEGIRAAECLSCLIFADA